MKAFESTLLDIPSQTYNKSSLVKTVKTTTETLTFANSATLSSELYGEFNTTFQLGTISLDRSSLVSFSFETQRQHRDGTFDADLIITDSDNAHIAELSVELWRESGWDDGAWTEDQLTSAPRIVLPKGNNYQISLTPTAMTGWSEISVKGKVTRNVVSTLPIILAVCFLVLMLILLSIKKSKFIKASTGIRD